MSEPFETIDVLWMVFAEVSTGSLAVGNRARRDLPVLALRSQEEAQDALSWLRAHPRLGRTSGGNDVTYHIWPQPVPLVKTLDVEELRVISMRAMDLSDE